MISASIVVAMENALPVNEGALRAAPPSPGRVGTLVLPMAGLVLLALLAYSNAHHDRLSLDSTRLSQDPVLADWHGALRRFFQSGLRPGQDLATLTFAANYALNVRRGLPGLDVTGVLRVNVFLHAANAVLVFALAKALLKRTTLGDSPSMVLAFLSAALFVVHPLNVTSVVDVVHRSGLLASVFYLAALLSYLKVGSAPRLGMKFTWGLIAAIATALSVKSEPVGLTIPLAILALEYCLNAARTDRPRRMPRYGVYLLMACVAYLLGTSDWRQAQTSALVQQLFTQMVVIAIYWKLLFLPLPGWLCFDHAYPLPSDGIETVSIVCFLLHVAVVMAAIWAARRGWLAAGFGIILSYLTLLPWMFTVPSEQLVEHRTYLCAIGAALALAELICRIRTQLKMSIQAPALLIAVFALILITRQRNALFQNPIALWQDIAVKYPDSFRAQAGLGSCLAESRQYSEALEAFGRADRLRPYNAWLHFNMGNALRGWGKFDEAIAEYREARRIAGGDLHVAVNLSDTLLKVGQDDEAFAVLQSGIAGAWPGTDPAVRAIAHFNLGNLFASGRRWDEAEREYRESIAANPNYTNAYKGLGVALDEQDRTLEAIEALYTALRLKPNDPEALQTLDVFLTKQWQSGH